jgi:hypothetical protein
VVSFAKEVPGNAQLVVRSKRGTRVLYVALLSAGAVLVAAFVAIVVLAILGGNPLLFMMVPLFLSQFGLTGLIVREYQGLLGPQLAADHSGVWVRTGLGRRPEVVYLPWQAIDGIDIGKGPTVRILSRQGEAFYRRPPWRVRSLRRRFGTAFLVDGRRSAEPPDQIAHRLRQLAQWASHVT